MTVRTEPTEQVEASQVEPAKTPNRLPTITTMILAVAFVALGAWVVYDMNTVPDTAVTTEIENLLDDYLAAWNTSDGEAFVELVTAGYTLDMVGGVASATERVEGASELINSLEPMEWSVAVVGERMMTGDGPWYVTEVEHFTAPGYGAEGADGVSTFTVVDDGGTLKIARHAFVGNN